MKNYGTHFIGNFSSEAAIMKANPIVDAFNGVLCFAGWQRPFKEFAFWFCNSVHYYHNGFKLPASLGDSQKILHGFYAAGTFFPPIFFHFWCCISWYNLTHSWWFCLIKKRCSRITPLFLLYAATAHSATWPSDIYAGSGYNLEPLASSRDKKTDKEMW